MHHGTPSADRPSAQPRPPRGLERTGGRVEGERAGGRVGDRLARRLTWGRCRRGLCTLAIAATALRCGAGDEGADFGRDAQGGVDRRRADSSVDAWVRSDSGVGLLKLNPLCGAVGACYPDLQQGCGLTLRAGAGGSTGGGTPWLLDASVSSVGGGAPASERDSGRPMVRDASDEGDADSGASTDGGGGVSLGAGGASPGLADAGVIEDGQSRGGGGLAAWDAVSGTLDVSIEGWDAARFDASQTGIGDATSESDARSTSDAASNDGMYADQGSSGYGGVLVRPVSDSGGTNASGGAGGSELPIGLAGDLGAGGSRDLGGASTGIGGLGPAEPVFDAAMDAPPPQACYLRVVSSATQRSCETAGARLDEEPCEDSRDCASGRACVETTDADAGHRFVCRTLACTVPVTCPNSSTFYDELPLREGGKTTSVLVPVCSPADDCTLLEQSCAERHACAVVGDGVTTCLPMGTAARNEPCSNETRCAPGLVCAKTTSRCMKLCHVDSHECGEGVCQGRTLALPAQFGVCIDAL